MKILQSGVDNSNNFWLSQIITNIIKQAGKGSSHSINPRVIEFKNNKCYWSSEGGGKEEIAQLDDFINSCSHIISTTPINENSTTIYPKFDKIIYLIRDPRDLFISEAEFTIATHSESSYLKDVTLTEYLQEHFTSSMIRWREHVINHLRYAKQWNIHILFYERMINDFYNELYHLLKYLKIDLDEVAKQEIVHTVNDSDDEINSWYNKLPEEYIEKSLEINGDLLELLNYQTDAIIPGKFPEVPDELSLEFIESKFPTTDKI